ncbi:kinase-like protein [Aspergillus eucalypticola CBS 122712]|uniref:Kinase-like protein n=1 Tax=Aspergillus eucalypticola (strain CBS 122712 / IBT 29274) TaxID=1448314 RepID=A0A317VAL1_ASPEC|nr:kinase-like protein [Aspergillus eucalypticola CBS 122712]PWY69952.1 kinase-like protein [Aspergillus eucalypticola CBS 122712]
MTSTTDDTPYFQYQPIEQVERLESRYKVIDKLGHGTFSTIWLSRDEQKTAYVAVKVSTGDASTHEAKILGMLKDRCLVHPNGRPLIPVILDEFQIEGPNGHHKCIITAPAQSSVSAALFCCYFQIETTRVLNAELALAVAFVHAQGFVHGDIHLGNILLNLPTSLDKLSVQDFYEQFGEPYTEPVVRLDGQPLPPGVPTCGTLPAWLGKRAKDILPFEAQLLLSDFGESFCPLDPEQRRRGQDCPSPLPVIPPEAYFEPDKPLSFPSDIWSLACAMYPLFGLRWLFDATLATQHDIASQQVDTIGDIPLDWWNTWEKRHEYFEEIERPNKDRYVWPSLEQRFEKDIQAARQRDNVSSFDNEEKVAILSMLRSMLAMRPEKRATATDVLSSDWMVTWGLPAVKRARNSRQTGGPSLCKKADARSSLVELASSVALERTYS